MVADDHHNGFPTVPARPAAVDPDELAELLTDAWRAKARRSSPHTMRDARHWTNRDRRSL